MLWSQMLELERVLLKRAIFSHRTYVTRTEYQRMFFGYLVACSRLRIGKLTRYSVTYLRHLRDFFGAYFRLKPDPQTSTVRAKSRRQSSSYVLLVDRPRNSGRLATPIQEKKIPKVLSASQTCRSHCSCFNFTAYAATGIGLVPRHWLQELIERSHMMNLDEVTCLRNRAWCSIHGVYKRSNPVAPSSEAPESSVGNLPLAKLIGFIFIPWEGRYWRGLQVKKTGRKLPSSV